MKYQNFLTLTKRFAVSFFFKLSVLVDHFGSWKPIFSKLSGKNRFFSKTDFLCYTGKVMKKKIKSTTKNRCKR